MFGNQSWKKISTRWTFAAVLLPAIAAGCARPVGTVSGKVTFQNQPLPAGSVTFVHADGTTVSGSIQAGSYSISEVPAGSCTVLVIALPPPRSMWNPEQNKMVGNGDAPNKVHKSISLPARYGDPKQSDLHHEVTSGSQTFNIDLKP